MYDELKEFNDIEDLSIIDFTDGAQWAWGFGHDQNEGFIYHFPFPFDSEKSMYCIAYKVPPFMVEMITKVRDAALSNLKREILSLDRKRDRLLEI